MVVLVGEEDDFNLTLAEMLDIDLVPVDFRAFKDREICSRIADRTSLGGNQVLLCLRKSPEENPNEYINKFLFTAGCIKSQPATTVVGIMPYFVYARQDKDFLAGKKEIEPVSVNIVLEMLNVYMEELVTFNSHFERKQGVIPKFSYRLDKKIEIHNLDVFGLFDDQLSNIENLVIVAPDKGMRDFAEELAKRYDCEFDYLDKERDRTSGDLKFMNKEFSIKNKNVIIPDDIVSSGNTLIKGIEFLRAYEPKHVYTMFVHGAFAAGAYEKLKEVSDGLLFTDTLKNSDVTVKVAPYLVQYMRDVKLLNL